MKFSDYIKNFLNKTKIKELPLGSTIQTDIISIKYKDKYEKKFAEFIREEIDENKEFYKVFLEEYDGISFGGENSFKNPLKIENEISKLEWKLERRFNLECKMYEIFGKAVLSKYSDNKECPSFKTMRPSMYSDDFKQVYLNEEVEKLFYRLLTVENLDIKYCGEFLCYKKDWKGLKLFLDSKDQNEFKEKYIDENLFKILNKMVDITIDKSDNNFFEKNIDLISKAVHLGKEDYRKNNERRIKDLKSILYDEKDEVENNEDKNNIEMNNSKIIELVEEILGNIDSTKKLQNSFKEKMNSNKVIIFNENDENEAIEKLEKMDFLEEVESIINKGAQYRRTGDVCIIPIENKITDIPVIIHEFIHQYNYNKGKISSYSMEIPAIYFEKKAMDYLVNNGYEQCEELFQKFFQERKNINTFNNIIALNRFVDITKIKKDDGEITIQNILNKKEAAAINYMQNNISEEEISMTDTRRYYAKSVLESFSKRNQKIDEDIKVLCSYSLGTYFAEEYSKNDKIKSKMFELIDSPFYSIQHLIKDINEQEKELTIKQEPIKREVEEIER